MISFSSTQFCKKFAREEKVSSCTGSRNVKVVSFALRRKGGNDILSESTRNGARTRNSRLPQHEKMPSPLKMTRSAPTRLLDAPMFNRYIKAIQRAKADAHSQDTLHARVATHMIERRKFVKRKTPVVLDVGAHSGWFLRHMLNEKGGETAVKDWGIKQYIQVDVSEEALDNVYHAVKDKLPPEIELVQICADEEQPRPFEVPDRSIDMAVSCLSLHWVNQLEPAMINIRNVLRRDGFLLLAMFGGNTLFELRSAFALSDVECKGGVSAHVSPQIDGAGISTLVLQSGFTLPAVDMDRFVLSYKDAFQLCEHLQRMGEQACHLSGSGRLATSNRTTLAAMAAVYDKMYRKNGRCPATFEVFHSICWAPSPQQPQPLERGSGQISLASVGTSLHKEFSRAMAEAAKNPNDKALQERADALYKELRKEMEQQAQRGLGSTPEMNELLSAENQRIGPNTFPTSFPADDAAAAAGGDDAPMAAVGNVSKDHRKNKEAAAAAAAAANAPPSLPGGTMVRDLQERAFWRPGNQPLPPGEQQPPNTAAAADSASGVDDATPEGKAGARRPPANMNPDEEERWQQFEAFMAAAGVDPNAAPTRK